MKRFFLQRESQMRVNLFLITSWGLACSVWWSPHVRPISGIWERSQRGCAQTVACLIPPEAPVLWSSTSVAPLISYSVKCLCLCMMDVSLTQVNGRKFSPAFKCIAFLVLSNTHTHTHTHTVRTFQRHLAFNGIWSTDRWFHWWESIFVSPWLYSCHTRREQSASSSFFWNEYLISLNFALWLLLSLSFFPVEGEEKLSTVYRVN